MLFILQHSDHSIENQRALRCWYIDNGLLFSELADPALVDSVAQTITVNKKVPVAGQDDFDFPEFVVDGNDEPVTVQQVIPLAAAPLRWMLTKTGAWNPDWSPRSAGCFMHRPPAVPGPLRPEPARLGAEEP